MQEASKPRVADAVAVVVEVGGGEEEALLGEEVARRAGGGGVVGVERFDLAVEAAGQAVFHGPGVVARGGDVEHRVLEEVERLVEDAISGGVGLLLAALIDVGDGDGVPDVLAVELSGAQRVVRAALRELTAGFQALPVPGVENRVLMRQLERRGRFSSFRRVATYRGFTLCRWWRWACRRDHANSLPGLCGLLLQDTSVRRALNPLDGCINIVEIRYTVRVLCVVLLAYFCGMVCAESFDDGRR